MAKSVRGTFSPEQIQADLRQGDSPIVLMAKGEFIEGNVVVTDADGNAVDGGAVPGGGGGGGCSIEVNDEVVCEGGSGGGTQAISVGWQMGTGIAGTNVGRRVVSPRVGQFTGGRVVVDASDGATALTFTINKNGTPVFSAPQTIAAAAAAGTVADLTAGLAVNPTPVAAGDVFTLDISGGSASWKFMAVVG